MKRYRDNNGRFVKAEKKLVIGDNITSFDQLKDGMLVDFMTDDVNVQNAIIVFDMQYNRWFAVHNVIEASGEVPNEGALTHGKKYGWHLGYSKDEIFGIDYSDMIFRGWRKKEGKAEKQAKAVDKKELVIGDKITSFDQLKEGMLVDLFFLTNDIKVQNAIIVFDMNEWFAVHNNNDIRASGYSPKVELMHGKKYGWTLGYSSEKFGSDYKDMIFRGWYKKEEKTEVKEEVKPVAKVEAKNPYKIGDFVKWYSLEDKQEVVGVYENYVWLISPSRPVPFSKEYHAVSPWVEPIKLKYKKGDLVRVGSSVYKITTVVAAGYHIENIIDVFAGAIFVKERDIIRKVGVATEGA